MPALPTITGTLLFRFLICSSFSFKALKQPVYKPYLPKAPTPKYAQTSLLLASAQEPAVRYTSVFCMAGFALSEP